MHVCFIDDHEDQIAHYRDFLAKKGCDVSYYHWLDSGQSFFAEGGGETDLVVVLDLYWGAEMKGPAILRSLRQWRPALPVIVLTQTTNTDDILSAIQDWGATRTFVKRPPELDEKLPKDLDQLWSVVEQSAKETGERHKELQSALTLARATDSRSQFEGLRKCRAIIGSMAEPHIPALKGQHRALRGLLEHGIKQDHLPLVDVLKELQDTSSRIYSEDPHLDRENLQSWVMACKHLGEPDGVAQLGAACLVSLRYHESLLHDLIRWQIRRDEAMGVRPEESSLTCWLTPLDGDKQLSAHLRLALALRQCAEVTARVIAESYVARLCSLTPDEAASAIEREFQASDLDQEKVLDILASGDPGGQKVSPILMRVVGCRLDAETPKLPVLLRTVPLVERLSKWRANNLPAGELQRRAANLAFQLYAHQNVEAIRDRCLTVACQEQAWSGEAAITVLDLLAESDVSKLVETYDTWLQQAKTNGKADVADALVKWAVDNREKVLQGPAELPLLRRLITALAQAGEHVASVDYVIRTVERSLEDLWIVPKSQIEATVVELRNLLEYAKPHAGDLSSRVEQLDEQFRAVAVRASELPKVLDGKRMAIVAGTQTNAGSQVLSQYKNLVETHLGAECELFEVERDNRITALCGAIKGGGFQIVVIVKGSVEHSNAGRVGEACEQAARFGQEVTLVPVSTQAVGARAVFREIVKELHIPVEELPGA